MYYVYILSNKTNSVVYIGITNDLCRRMYEHKNSLINGFSTRYKTRKLVYFESSNDVKDAISREKRLKGLLRIKKNQLIESTNPNWDDLSFDVCPDLFD